jgi:hypothetical protein
MEHNADLEQFAGDIYDEVTKNNKYILEIPTDNTELENFTVTATFRIWESGTFYIGYEVSSKRVTACSDRCDMEVYRILGRTELPMFPIKKETLKKMKREQILVDIQNALCTIDDDVENLFLDNRRGVFVNRKHDDCMRVYRMSRNVDLIFKHKKVLSSPFDICVVCHETTQTKTACDHRLCVDCWNKLEKLTCPCCRENIDFAQHSDNDDE